MATTHIPVMQVAFELVEQAERAGIPIRTVSTYGDANGADILLLPMHPSDARGIGEVLGLQDYRCHTNAAGTTIEAWYGVVGDDVCVHTQHGYPARAAATS